MHLIKCAPYLRPLHSDCCCVSQISEKQKSLYEALEKQQRYQGSLQSISAKMESLEVILNEPPMHDLSPDRQMILHQVFHVLKHFTPALESVVYETMLTSYYHTWPESDGGHCQTSG